MSQAVTAILSALGGGGAVALAITFLLLYNPEKIEKWSALLWRLLSHFRAVFRGAHKQYLKHDLQGRLNEFAKGLGKEAPFLGGTRVQVEWTDESATKKSFLEEGKVVLRLKRDDREEMNFVQGAFMFVSTSLLAKVKRYISPSQCLSVDLYMTTDLLEKEKPSVVGLFLDEYLHPETADPKSKVSQYIDSFTKIDEGGLFKSVVLQELGYLGQKVFGRRRDQEIIMEVDDLIRFLEPIATRRIGDVGDLHFEREYCRCAIMIVGKPTKLSVAGHAPYVEFVKKQLIPKRIETLYVLGLTENKEPLDLICECLNDDYEKVRSRASRVILRYGDERIQRDQYLVVLRMRGARVLQASA